MPRGVTAETYLEAAPAVIRRAMLDDHDALEPGAAAVTGAVLQGRGGTARVTPLALGRELSACRRLGTDLPDASQGPREVRPACRYRKCPGS